MPQDYDNSAPALDETLSEKARRVLEMQLVVALAFNGQVTADTAEAIYSLACAYRELAKDE
jgi:hypothetical protein